LVFSYKFLFIFVIEYAFFYRNIAERGIPGIPGAYLGIFWFPGTVPGFSGTFPSTGFHSQLVLYCSGYFWIPIFEIQNQHAWCFPFVFLDYLLGANFIWNLRKGN